MHMQQNTGNCDRKTDQCCPSAEMWERRDHGTLPPVWCDSKCNMWHLTCLSALLSSHFTWCFTKHLWRACELLAMLRHLKSRMEACYCSHWQSTLMGSLEIRQTSIILSVTLDLPFTDGLGMVIKSSGVLVQGSLSKFDVLSYLTILILCCV